MITDYTIITSCRTDALVETVVEMIGDGWQPLGGIVLAYERNIHRLINENDVNLPNDFEHYAQAMVKVEQHSVEEIAEALLCAPLSIDQLSHREIDA